MGIPFNPTLHMKIYQWLKDHKYDLIPAIPIFLSLLMCFCALLYHLVVGPIWGKCNILRNRIKPRDEENLELPNIHLRRESYLDQVPNNRRSDSITSISELRVFESTDNVETPSSTRSDSITSISPFSALSSVSCV